MCGTRRLLAHELAEMRLGGKRGGRCAAASLAVALATCWPWPCMSMKCGGRRSAASCARRRPRRRRCRRAFCASWARMAGAGLALLLSPWLPEDAVGTEPGAVRGQHTGRVGLLVSGHGYAWLLGAITADMVLMALLSDPASALDVGCDRTARGDDRHDGRDAGGGADRIGCGATPAAPAPGWSDLLGEQWPAMRHAVRAGLGGDAGAPGVALAGAAEPVADGDNRAAVMAVPSLSNDPAVDQQLSVERAMQRHRRVPCGGVAGLVCLAFSVESFLPWMLMLTVGVWVCAHVQASQRGIGYVGTQGAVVFISTLVQGAGPPTSILPGIERFAGIMGGLLILLTVLALTGPSVKPLVVRRGSGLFRSR